MTGRPDKRCAAPRCTESICADLCLPAMLVIPNIIPLAHQASLQSFQIAGDIDQLLLYPVPRGGTCIPKIWQRGRRANGLQRQAGLGPSLACLVHRSLIVLHVRLVHVPLDKGHPLAKPWFVELFPWRGRVCQNHYCFSQFCYSHNLQDYDSSCLLESTWADLSGPVCVDSSSLSDRFVSTWL